MVIYLFSHSELNDFHIERLADALTHNTLITKLNLSHNNIQAEGCIKIAEALQKNPSTLETLLLDNNPIGSEGAIELFKALKTHLKLRELNLSKCGISTYNSSIALKDMLETNRSLKYLVFKQNHLQGSSLQQVFDSLKRNTTLNTLILCNTFVDQLESLTSALVANKTLTSLSLSHPIPYK